MNIYKVTIVEEGARFPYSTSYGIAESVNQAGALALAQEAPEEDEEDLGPLLSVQSVEFIAVVEYGMRA